MWMKIFPQNLGFAFLAVQAAVIFWVLLFQGILSGGISLLQAEGMLESFPFSLFFFPRFLDSCRIIVPPSGRCCGNASSAASTPPTQICIGSSEQGWAWAWAWGLSRKLPPARLPGPFLFMGLLEVGQNVGKG